MVEKKSGVCIQKSKLGVIEMNQAQRSDDYNTFAVKAATALELNVEPTSVLKIFEVSGGTLIQDDNISIKEISRKWTLGNYLTLLKKSHFCKDWSSKC